MNTPTTTLTPWQIEDAARLKALFDARADLTGEKLSQAEFGERYKIGSQGMVSQYLQARRPLNVDAAVAFAKGLGVSINEFSPQIAKSIQHASEFATKIDGEASAHDLLPGARRVAAVDAPRYATIPIKMVNLSLQAGIMGFEASQMRDDDGTLDVPAQWIDENEFVPHCLLGIKVKGESMQPMLYEDDVVVVNIADNKKVNGGVFAINFNGEAVIKRLKYENREWYLTSENPAHKQRMCRSGECIIVGRVVRLEARNFKDRL